MKGVKMNAKEGIVWYANDLNKNLKSSEVKTFKNDENKVFLYWKKDDYIFRYEGKSTWFTWKGFVGNCKTPKIVKKLYERAING